MTCVPRSLEVIQARFWNKTIVVPSGCIVWLGATDDKGYGVFICWIEGQPAQQARKAHQWAHDWAKGPVPKGLEIDHVCRVRNCVNAAHMREVTHRENLETRRIGRSGGWYCRVDDPWVDEIGNGLAPEHREEVA